MQMAGHSVAIVTNRYPRTLPEREVIDNISIRRLQFLYPRLTYFKTRRLDLWLAGWVYFPLTLIQLLIIIFRFQPDVVDLHYLGSPALFLLALHHLLRFRLVVSLHGGDVDGEPHQNRFNRWLFNAVLAQSEQVTACSQALLDQALLLAPGIATKAQVIHNGVDITLFVNARPYPHPRPYVLGVGQLASHKGFDLLIRAFGRVASRFPTVDMIIAGDGPEKEILQRLGEDVGLQGHIFFPGKISSTQVASLMAGSCFVAIPSYREAFGLVALEAMATGKRVLLTPVGGLPEFAFTPTNLMVPPREDLWADALGKLLGKQNNGGNSDILAENQHVVATHRWESVSGRYLEILATAAKSPDKRKNGNKS
jgi:glycosyltransferase involved in cell wall biosynthesis